MLAVGLSKFMKVWVAISKRRAKRLAAAVLIHSADLSMWEQLLYTVCDGKVAPFAMQSYDTLEKAMVDACETLKVTREDFVELEEADIESHILKSTRDEWHPVSVQKGATGTAFMKALNCPAGVITATPPILLRAR